MLTSKAVGNNAIPAVERLENDPQALNTSRLNVSVEKTRQVRPSNRFLAESMCDTHFYWSLLYFIIINLLGKVVDSNHSKMIS